MDPAVFDERQHLAGLVRDTNDPMTDGCQGKNDFLA